MKKNIKNLVLVLFLAIGISMNAAKIDLEVNGNQSVVVQLKNVKEGSMLKLQDGKGEIIYLEDVSGKQRKVLNLKNLPEGEYLLTLEDNFSISSSSIFKNSESLKVNDGENFTFKPNYLVEGKNLHFQYMNPMSKNTSVQIFDAAGVKVGESKCDDVVVKRRFDFSNMPAGEYMVKVQAGEKNFYKTLKVG